MPRSGLGVGLNASASAEMLHIDPCILIRNAKITLWRDFVIGTHDGVKREVRRTDIRVDRQIGWTEAKCLYFCG